MTETTNTATLNTELTLELNEVYNLKIKKPTFKSFKELNFLIKKLLVKYKILKEALTTEEMLSLFCDEELTDLLERIFAETSTLIKIQDKTEEECNFEKLYKEELLSDLTEFYAVIFTFYTQDFTKPSITKKTKSETSEGK
jgi:hypothetical protein